MSLSREDIRKLSERRWSVSVLATLVAHGGSGRFVILLNTVNCTRSALSATLDQLIAHGWVRHNPGHGHPLRPEYVLTENGMAIALCAQGIEATAKDLDLTPATFRRWTLPLTCELRESARRFTALKTELAPATPRALSLTLKQMMGDELVSRTIVESFPPTPLYELTARGQDLATAIRTDRPR